MDNRGRSPSSRRSATWLGWAAVLQLAAGAAAAQGNVSVLLDGHGDLRLIGDDQANRVVLLEVFGTDGLTIQGWGGTTVNGEMELRVVFPGTRAVLDMRGGDDSARFAVFEEGGCCGFDVVFLGGEGNDTFFVGDEEAGLGRVWADLGPGNDRFWAGEGGSVGELVLLGGEGDDVLDGYYSFMSAGATVDMGPGNDLVHLPEHAIRGPLWIDLGTGADTAILDGLYLHQSLVLDAGEGDDLVEMTGEWRSRPGGVALVDTGDGADHVLVGGLVEVDDGTTVRTGDGRDSVTLESVHATRRLDVDLGEGDDLLRMRRASFSYAASAVLDGASGYDHLRDLGGNRYEVEPTFVGFEGPKARVP